VGFEWDEAKAAENLRKHGIDFADAATATEDEFCLEMRDDSTDEEERWVCLGMDALARILVVVYTWRGENRRLISARESTPRERQQYTEGEP
jgi:uncharacterized DUF497 family protein